jgi:thiamine-monophosphate kinase
MPSPDTIPPNALPADLGEFGLVEALTSRFAQADNVIVGPGDDAAIVAVPDGRVVISTDVLVDTRHFRRDWASAADIGHKAAAQNLSDINAMGGRATALTVGLALPADLPVAWVLEMAEGFAEECALVGASVVGGDITRANELVIAVSVIGTVDGDPVLRSGARPGDIVAICGRQGWAAAGLAVLGRGFRSPRVLVEAHRRPDPPYAAGAAAMALGATAMIDVSDGLLGDLGHVAAASGVAVDVTTAAFDVAEPLQAVAAATGVEPMRFILTGGDDHAIVATFPAGTELPDGWTVIGSVGEGEGVTVDGSPYDGPTGHTHF